MRALALATAIGMLAAPAAFAQSDIIGEWGFRNYEDSSERQAGPDVGEFVGVPTNDAAKRYADTWSASLATVPEHQCRPHPADYQFNFTGVRILKDVDPLTQKTVAYRTTIAWMNPSRVIWMDGRPHPGPEALHTWEGFSTGRWEGDTLVVDTTHLKTGYVRRNGMIRSHNARMREYFTRVGNVLTWTVIEYDPAYLTEPLIRNRDYELDPGFQVTIYPCEAVVEVPRPEGEIPHYLPGTNDGLDTFAQNFNLPAETTRGGADSMYPEFESRIVGGYKAPTPAKRGAR